MKQAEFEGMILKIKDKLFRFALSILRDEENAQDAVQEVVLKLWEKKNRLDASQNIECFCMSSLRNHCFDVLRRNKQFEDYSKSMEINPVALQNYEQDNLIEQIKKELENLPLQQRIAIELKDFQGYSYDEMSKILDLSVNAIRANVSRGRKRLHQLFKEELENV